jgi:hypothetical protein
MVSSRRDGRQPVLDSEIGDLRSLTEERAVRHNNEGPGPLSDHRREGQVEPADVPDLDGLKLHAECSGPRLGFSQHQHWMEIT